jgi:hypothetical protein
MRILVIEFVGRRDGFPHLVAGDDRPFSVGYWLVPQSSIIANHQ